MNIHGAINELITMQEILAQAFCEKFPVALNDPFLSNCPKTGELIVEDALWVFHKHGLGYRFESSAGPHVIEFHRGFPTDTRVFDAWALLCYLEGHEGVELDLEDAIIHTINELVDRGDIRPLSGHRYELIGLRETFGG